MDQNNTRYEAWVAIPEMIARNAPLERTLTAICAMIDHEVPEAMSSIMLFDQEQHTLSFAAGNRLPESFRMAAQQVPIGPDAAICGSAAFHRKMVVSDDILQDPRCTSYRELARGLQLRAGWSCPVLTKNRELLGTFAIYYSVPGKPAESQRRPIERAAALVALAIERHWDRHNLIESDQRYRSLFTHNPDAVFSLDRVGVLKSVNPATAKITGLSEARLIGMHYRDFIPLAERHTMDRAFNAAIQGKPQRYEIRIADAAGKRHTLDVSNLPIIVDGEVVGVYGVAKDVTDRKAQEMQLRILQRGVETSVNGVVIADAGRKDLPLIYANKAFLCMTGYTLEEVLGRNCRFLNGPETDADVLRELREHVIQSRETRVTLLNYRKDGTTFWNDLFVSPVYDDAGHISHFVGIQHDVSAQKANEANLEYQANHEPLTGLPNRSLFETRLNHHHAELDKRQALLAVLYIDLDDFKPVNDTLGHAVGDQLLKSVARRLSTVLSPGDTLASVGGDEFVVLLPNLDEKAQALVTVERALHLLAEPFRVDGHEILLTGSVGIALNDSTVEQPTELIQHADMAMYLAKRLGRNTYYWYSQHMTSAMNERVDLRRMLHDAILGDQFELYYQPLIDARTGSVEGFEALIRWHHATHGLVSPATFIPLAEQTGQIIAIGDWVLNRAFSSMVSLNRQHGSNYWVSVNVSPLQFHGRHFLESLIEALRNTELPASCLNIELTEGVLMENTDSAIDVLRTLRSMDIGIFIDDFGTGFSSLSYLKHLPVDKVKIDRTFTRDITTDFYDTAIAQGIISMAHNLELEVVAEGIETQEQHDLLAAHGSDLLQGYLFARPMPWRDLPEYLQAQNRSETGA